MEILWHRRLTRGKKLLILIKFYKKIKTQNKCQLKLYLI